MPQLNGNAAVAAMLARTTNVPGTCLNTVWQAYGSHPSVGPHAGQYPDAIDGWRYATKRHPGDLYPPAGYPVYFDALPRPRYAGDTNYASGDVVLSIGGGLVRCTDGSGSGRMGTMTIPQRAAQIGRTYLGWTEDFLGYEVVTSSSPASTNATPISNKKDEDDDMAAAVILREQSKQMWLAADNGDLTLLKDMDEVNSLIACGAVRPVKDAAGNVVSWWIQLPDGTIIDRRKRVANRKLAQEHAGKLTESLVGQ